MLAVPAQGSGLLLVVEDIHWADAPTRELLDYVARRVRALGIMVLVTCARAELHRQAPAAPDALELEALGAHRVQRGYGRGCRGGGPTGRQQLMVSAIQAV